MPAEQFTRVAVDDQRQRRPTISACPDTAQISRPAVVGSCCNGWLGLAPWSWPYGTLLYLPALQLEDALHVLLVRAQQLRNRPMPDRRRFFDHRFDRFCQFRFDLRRGLCGLVIHRAAGNTEP